MSDRCYFCGAPLQMRKESDPCRPRRILRLAAVFGLALTWCAAWFR